MPTADAAANGPKQASLEGGTGGSDLAAAFKILSLHLPRVLGAGAIAPSRLLNSPGSAGVAAPAGVSPYAQAFQMLLQSMSGAGGGYGGGSPDFASLLGGSGSGSSSSSGGGLQDIFGGSSLPDIFGGGDASGGGGGIPDPRVTLGHDFHPLPPSLADQRTGGYSGGTESIPTNDPYQI
jgi:hypothetical protein